MEDNFTPTNRDLYAYAANNPVHYIDPDGNIIVRAVDIYKMQDSRWHNEYSGNSSLIKIKTQGCFLTGFSLIDGGDLGVKNRTFVEIIETSDNDIP